MNFFKNTSRTYFKYDKIFSKIWQEFFPKISREVFSRNMTERIISVRRTVAKTNALTITHHCYSASKGDK